MSMTKRFRRFIQAWCVLGLIWCVQLFIAFSLQWNTGNPDSMAFVGVHVRELPWWFRPLLTQDQLGYLSQPLSDMGIGASSFSPFVIVGGITSVALAVHTLLLLFLLLMHFTARRKIAGVCDRCGYDLRATPDRCPECGQIA